MLNSTKNFIAFFLFKFTPLFFVSHFINFVYLIEGRYALGVLRRAPLNKLKKLQCRFIVRHEILTDEELSTHKVLVVDEERYETIKTPNVFKLVENNFQPLLH